MKKNLLIIISFFNFLFSINDIFAQGNSCASAVTLTPSGSCSYTAGSTASGFTGSGIGCTNNGANGNDDDGWYKFVATNTSHTVKIDGATGFDPVISAYSNCSGTTVTGGGCTDNTGGGGIETLNLSGLTVGNTYYIQVFDYGAGGGAFDICIIDPSIPNNQDCLGAIPICQNTYSQATAYSGTGNVANEINSTPSCLESGEKNDVWYTFTVQASGNLNFTIDPNINTDDYDWAVYNLTNNNCSDIYSTAALEVSCNYDPASGNTGPNGGSGWQEEPVIPVTAGQTYVINVSQYSTSTGGYSINFGASTATIFDNVKPVLTSISSQSCGSNTFVANFSENVLCSTVSAADFTVTGPGGPYTISLVQGGNCAIGGTQENSYTFTISPALTSAGTYTLGLNAAAAGSVSDLCGNIANTANFNFTVAGPTITASTTTNVSCNGGSNGVVTTTAATGGASPYTYAWSPAGYTGGTTQTYSGLPAGTYTITVTDAGGCQGISTATVTQPAVLSGTNAPTNPGCASLGSITVTPSGGTSPYTYSWSPSGGTGATAGSLAAGTYTVTITDNKGCTKTVSSTLVQTGSVTAGIQPIANDCFTANSSTATITAGTTTGGGTTYSWNWGDATANGTGSSATHSYAATGTYTITLTVTQGSCSNTATQNVTIYPMPTASITSFTNVNCNGGSTGSITASGGGTYSWSPSGGTGATASGLAANTYTVTVTDANGCTATASQAITQPAALTSSVTPQTNVTCNGGANGSATVVPAGGTSPYTYSWSPSGGSAASATGLTAQTYTVTITDNKGCTKTQAVNITQPAGMTVTTAVGTAPGCGLSNGTATSTVTGGTSPYTYSWSPSGGTGATGTGMPAGGYTLTVTDNVGCTKTSTVTLSNPSAPTATITASANVSCNGGTNGSATVSGTGGTTPYTYLWSPSGGTAATASSLAPGTYTVTVKDNVNCTGSATVTITEPTLLSASIASSVNPACTAANGSVTSSASGGTSPYTYSWSPSGGTGVTASGLTAGTYTVTVTDNKGCIKTASQTITATGSITASASSTNVNCFGATTGTASASGSGGTGTYTYSWSSGSTSANISGLAANTYTVTVTDGNGCVSTASTTITQPAAALAATQSQTNVSCNAGTNGSATVTASGGTSPYTYAWTPSGGSAATASTLSSGSYTCTITDNKGCIVTKTFTITQPTALTNTSASTNSSCGASNGSASVTASGGTSPYTYAWSPSGGSSATASGLAAGAYTCTITDANSCTKVATVNVNNNTAGTASISSSTNVSCNGGTNGAATVTMTGGTSPFTYSWSPSGGTTATATGLTANTYTVTVTDANNCATTANVTITQPAALTGAITATTNVTCNGGANGSLTVTPTGGTSAYTYTWLPSGGTAATATGLAANTYTVTITDSKGCTTTASGPVTQPAAMIVTTGTTNATCGNPNGTATVSTVTNGTSPYTYSWNTVPVQTSQTATALAAAGYTVTVTDANGCVKTQTAAVSNTGGPTASIASSTNVNCNGGNNGSATISATGGTSPYTYSWNTTPAQTSSTAVALGAGSYTGSVTDANGCTSTSVVNITQPAALSGVMGTPTNVSCNGGSNGSVTVTASGGTSPYTYSWSTTPVQTTASASGLSAGSYTVTITDNKGCTTTSSVSITQPATLSITPTQTNITCSGGSNGSATATVSGGTTPYTYAWSPSGGAAATASGLAAGTYSVTVTDAKGCVKTQSYTLTSSASITATTTKTDVLCNGGNTGSATVTPTGGVTPFTYSWSPSGGISSTATSLSAGTYTVSITDATGCTGSASVTINQPSALANSVTPVNILCNGICNGQATASVTGGTGSYTYQWNDGSLQTTATATGLCAGNYAVVVTDANSCSVTTNTSIAQPVAMTLTMGTVGSNCNQSNGSATVTVTNGASPYTYLWSSGASTATAPNLSAGAYNVTVTDANGCVKTGTTNVVDLGSPVASILSSGNVSCNGGNNGFANASVSGGTAPYSYAWNTTPVQTTSAASNLTAGTYTITISDPNGCQANTTVTITEPSVLSATISPQTNVTCNGGANGAATVVASGGTAPYTYLWTTAGTPTTSSVSGLLAGTYNVTVTDANNCVKNVPLTITEPTAISVSVTNNAAHCNLPDGNATASVTNGTSPYNYLWSNGANTATASNITPGSYSVTVTDVNGCTGTGNTTVGNLPAGIATISSSTNISCFGGNNGAATVSIGGGIGPYTYSWTNSATTQTATGLTSGSYTVTVTDASGCTSTATATITEPPAVNGTVTVNNVSCFGSCNGSATVVASGGVSPYTYLWNDPLNQTSATANGLCVGSASVVITDANGCTITKSATLTQPAAIAITPSNTDANCGQSNGTASVTVIGGTSPYTYAWSSGQSTASVTGLAANTYLCNVTDVNGCVKSVSITIANQTGPVIAVTSTTNVSCFGGNNGAATISATGGTSPFNFSWSNGQTAPSASNLLAGTYVVTVTDATNCTSSLSVNITEPTQIQTNATPVDPKCNGGSDGSISLSVNGGVSPYNYAWTPGTATTAAISGLTANTYTYIVTDANNCTYTNSVVINNPPFLIPTTTFTPTLCAGSCDGTATVSVVNGTAPYTYNWTPGGQTSVTATGLCAGTYSVDVVDANGCTTSASAIVTSPPALSATISGGNASCFGICDGYAQISVSGGTTPYSYNWLVIGNSSSNVNNLCAGAYTVNVADVNGCNISKNITITQPQQLIANITKTNVTCNSACDGSAISIITGGTGPYTYLWTPTLQGNNNAVNLCAGVHNLNVLDSNGCAVASSITITEPSLLALTTSVTSSNCGQSNGSATVSVIGGVAPYVYQWNDVNTQTGTVATALPANSYTITVTDASGCSQVATANVNDLTGPNVNIVSTTDPTCNGANNGSITTSISGGVFPYNINWNNAALPNSSNLTGLDGGNYTITVTDNAGCVNSQSTTLTEPDSIVSAITSFNNPNCYLGCDGSATVSVVGGSGSYSYLWNSNPTQTTANATGLCDGTYTCTITDVNGCSKTISKTLVHPTEIAVTAVVINNVSCAGGNNGSIVLTASGGTPGYTYSWTPVVSTGLIATNLSNGQYSAIVTDVKGCVKVGTYNIVQPSPISINVAAIPSTCGNANGSAQVTVTGGQSPFSILWTPTNQTGVTASNLLAGQYNVHVNDAGACIFDSLITVYDTPGPTMDSVTVVNPVCFGTPTGSATAYPKGGTSPLTYSWNSNPVQTSQTANSLTQGNYAVTITDNNGCQVSGFAILTQPPPVYVIGYKDSTLCFGQSMQLFATAGGGSGVGYTYSWTPSALSGPGPHNVSPTVSGTYTVIASDSKGCNSPVDNITISVKPPLTVTANDITLCEGLPGTLVATAGGGNVPPNTYHYQWSNNDTNATQTITLPPGQLFAQFIITVTDGCSTPAVDTLKFNVNPKPIAFITANDTAGCLPLDVNFTGSSNIGANYQWSFGDGGSDNVQNPSYSYNSSGLYNVSLTVTSAQGCDTTITRTGYINVYPQPYADFNATPQNTTLLNSEITFANTSVGGVLWNWNFGNLSTENDTSTLSSLEEPYIRYTYSDTGHYSVSLIVINEYGCVDSTREIIYVAPDYIFFAPNAFTPDADGLNEVFRPSIIGLDKSHYSLDIYDRWGDMIFQSTNYETGWDGKANGGKDFAQTDVYVWKIKTKDILGNDHAYMGHVTLIK